MVHSTIRHCTPQASEHLSVSPCSCPCTSGPFTTRHPFLSLPLSHSVPCSPVIHTDICHYVTQLSIIHSPSTMASLLLASTMVPLSFPQPMPYCSVFLSPVTHTPTCHCIPQSSIRLSLVLPSIIVSLGCQASATPSFMPVCRASVHLSVTSLCPRSPRLLCTCVHSTPRQSVPGPPCTLIHPPRTIAWLALGSLPRHHALRVSPTVPYAPPHDFPHPPFTF